MPDAKSCQLAVDDLGDGSPILLLHGFIGPASHLRPLAAALAASHRVLLPELPGYEATPALPGPYSMDAVAEQIELALLQRGVTSSAVVGFSLGGYRALSLACRGRLHISAVVTLGGFANLPETIRQGHREIAAALRAGVDLGDAAVAQFLSPACAAARPDAVREIKSWLAPARYEHLAVEAEAIADCADIRPQLSCLRVPVVARVGEADCATPLALSQEIVNVTRGRLEVVPGAGHALVAEDLAGAVASIQRVLSEHAVVAALNPELGPCRLPT